MLIGHCLILHGALEFICYLVWHKNKCDCDRKVLICSNTAIEKYGTTCGNIKPG